MRNNRKNRAYKKQKQNKNKLDIRKIVIETTDKNLIDCGGLITLIEFLKKINFFKFRNPDLPEV